MQVKRAQVQVEQVQVQVPDHRAPDEAVGDAEHVRVLLQLGHLDVHQLDVEVLVHGVQGTRDALAVPQLHHHLLPHHRFEERVEEHGCTLQGVNLLV